MGEAISFHFLPAFHSTLDALLDQALRLRWVHHRSRIKSSGLLDRDRNNRAEQFPSSLPDGLISGQENDGHAEISSDSGIESGIRHNVVVQLEFKDSGAAHGVSEDRRGCSFAGVIADENN